MYFRNILFLIILFSLCVSCSNSKDPIRRFCIRISKQIDSKYLEKFTALSENDRDHAIYFKHFETSIKKELNRNKTIQSLFQKNDVKDQNEQLYILYFSLHRTLNNKPIQLEQTIEYIKDSSNENEKRLKERNDCNLKREMIAQENYNNINIEDIITIHYPYYEGANNYKNAFLYDCPSTYKKYKDPFLSIEGEVIDKSTINPYNKRESLTLILKVLKNSNEDIPILMTKVLKGDTLNLNLELYGEKIDQE